MTTEGYNAKLENGILYLRFQNAILQQHRNRLKELGFSYNRSLKYWIGEHNHQLALQLARNVTNTFQHEMSQKSTICWKCSHSAKGRNSECSWARAFVPVEGWVAEPIYEKKSVYAKADSFDEPVSYRVDECPMFQADDG